MFTFVVTCLVNPSASVRQPLFVHPLPHHIFQHQFVAPYAAFTIHLAQVHLQTIIFCVTKTVISLALLHQTS